jgi:foldase protein PrsA
MNLLAQQRGTVLSEEEQQKIRAAANAYYASLSETEQQALGIDEPLIEELYGEYALANKVYAQIIENTDPEISDDEARTVTVSQIFLKTYAFDGEGNRTEYTDAAKRSEEEKIHNIKKQLTDGEDFDTLAARYNDGAQNTVSFRKGEVDAALEKAAFDLGNGEISDVIETEDGYYLLKCISTLDREQTDANKEKISQERKEEAFTNIYDEFVKTQIRKLNEDVWDQITFVDDDNVTTSQFFAMYDKYVGDMDTE